VGVRVGVAEGPFVGVRVGVAEGPFVGVAVGVRVGVIVGVRVGVAVAPPQGPLSTQTAATPGVSPWVHHWAFQSRPL
jgi:hypothetical protein